MTSMRKKVRQATALCALALVALTACEQQQADRRENGDAQADRWSSREMPQTEEKEQSDRWNGSDAEKMPERNGGDRWNGRELNVEKTAHHEEDANSGSWMQPKRDGGQRQDRWSRQTEERSSEMESDKAEETRQTWGDRQGRNGRQARRMGDVVQAVMGDQDLSTLVEAIKAAGLVETLQGRGPFTIFAPSNRAFQDLPRGKLQELLKPENRNQLRQILTYHVVSGRLTADQVARMKSLRTLEGQSLTITVRDGKVYVNDAEVEGVDMNGSNGVIHIIDKVLIPE